MGGHGTILVTDGEERSALAVVRSLGHAGYRVHVAARTRRALASASRWAASVLVTPDPLTRSAEFLRVVADHAAAHRIAVVIPVTDAAVLALLPGRAQLGGACIPCGSLEAYRALADKAGLAERAGPLGVAVPPEIRVEWTGRGETPLDRVRLPVVVKPARSVGESDGQRAKFTVRHAATGDALRAVIGSLPRAAFPLLVQERIVGPGVGVFLLVWNGQLVAHFAHRRLREKPPAGGVSVYAESIVASQDLVDRSRALVTGLGWEGVAMVEYKVDHSTATPYLMEINGRFWGSLQLAIDAGVDFPRLLVECAEGRPTGAPPAYRAGVRGRWWWGDVDHLVARLRHPGAALSLPPGAPTRSGAVRAFVAACLRRDADAVWRRADPRPFLAETAAWFRGA